MRGAPHLSFTGAPGRAEAVVLLLHGGTTESVVPVRAYDHAVLRMFPFGRSVIRAGDGRIVVATLRYAVRGWNGPRESPLADARWALDRINEDLGDLPIGLVGHSMGGRVALRVADRIGADAGGVRSVAALAPWLPPGESFRPLHETTLLLAHGTADRITDPARTAELAASLVADGGDVELVMLPGARHSMLFPARPWHGLVSRFMVRTLLAPAPEGPRGSRQD